LPNRVVSQAEQNGLIDFSSEVEVRSLYFDLPKFKVGGVRVLEREGSKTKTLTFNVLVLREEPIKVNIYYGNLRFFIRLIKIEQFDVQLEWYFEPGKNYEAAVTITSPYDKLRVLSISGQTHLDDYELRISYNNETTINSNGKINYQTKNLDVTVESSFEYLKYCLKILKCLFYLQIFV
jgi:hypothetical protein